jgi:hypothetical protein
MTVHERKLSVPIDPVKLDRLAELAIKVGLQLEAGQDLVVTGAHGGVALGAQGRRTCLSGRRRSCDPDPV